MNGSVFGYGFSELISIIEGLFYSLFYNFLFLIYTKSGLFFSNSNHYYSYFEYLEPLKLWYYTIGLFTCSLFFALNHKLKARYKSLVSIMEQSHNNQDDEWLVRDVWFKYIFMQGAILAVGYDRTAAHPWVIANAWLHGLRTIAIINTP